MMEWIEAGRGSRSQFVAGFCCGFGLASPAAGAAFAGAGRGRPAVAGHEQRPHAAAGRGLDVGDAGVDVVETRSPW